MTPSLFATQTGHTQLRRLFWLRTTAIAAQLLTLLLVYQFFSHDLDWWPMLGAVGFLVLLNGFSWWRLTLDLPVGHAELLAQLVGDVASLSVLLYYSGGSTNPFVSLYLLPLVIAAATLPRRHTWGMAALVLACYSLLMLWYVPLPALEQAHQHTADMAAAPLQPLATGNPDNHDFCLSQPAPRSGLFSTDAFNIHVLGMWLGFVISVIVVAYFVAEMARAVRQREAQLNLVREETLRNERIVALGMQAAGAAHELGTPLSTMAVVIGELQHDSAALPEWQDSLRLLDGQVRGCRTILDKLLANAQDAGHTTPQGLDQFLGQILDEWQLLRPMARYRFHLASSRPVPLLRIDPALRAALMNLLNNAADASPESIEITADWDAQRVTLQIHDHGPGLTPAVAASVGSAFFTTKEHGRGLGFFLANATLEKLGGSVRLYNREEGGATTEIILPLRDAT